MTFASLRCSYPDSSDRINPYAAQARSGVASGDLTHMIKSSHYPADTAQKSAGMILRPWHRLRAWFLARRIRRQHRELVKYVRRSAYEISAWKHDIGFLDQQLERHLTLAGVSLPVAPIEDKLVSMEESGILASAAHLAAVQ